MNLKNIVALNEKEIKVIKQVFAFSLSACLVVVAVTWGVQKYRAQSHKSSHEEIADASDVSITYGQHTKDFIAIDREAHQLAADYFARTNQSDKAIEHLLRLLSVDSDSRLLRMQLSEAYLRSGSPKKALKLLSLLNEEKESDSLEESIMALYGLALFHNGLIEQSVQVLDKALETYPLSAQAICYRGQVEAAINSSSDSAEAYFAKAIEINPGYAEAMYQWGRFLMNKVGRTDADLDSARIRLLSMMQIEPLNPKAHARLGMLYFYIGQFDIAEKSYKTSLALNPNDYNTHYNLGELYCSMYWNRKDLPEDDKRILRQKALTQFKKTLEIKSDHMEALFKTGLISLENDMLNEAVLHFEKARNLAPDSIRILLQLGVAYEKKNMPQEALATYNRILDLDPVNHVAQQKIKLFAGHDG